MAKKITRADLPTKKRLAWTAFGMTLLSMLGFLGGPLVGFLAVWLCCWLTAASVADTWEKVDAQERGGAVPGMPEQVADPTSHSGSDTRITVPPRRAAAHARIAEGRKTGSAVRIKVPAADPYDDEDDDCLDRELAALDDRWRFTQEGEAASFTYIDGNGEVTDRTIRNWYSDGAYVQGFCLSRRQNRTFRKDRIEDWIG